MSAVPRLVALSLAATAAVGVVVIGPAPTASALTCNAPEANIDPPPNAPDVTPPSSAPVPRRPMGRKPRGANEQAPLPKLGPLISALINPNTYRPSAPVQQRAAVVPDPNPPGAGNQPSPDATQLAPEAAPQQAQPEAAPPAQVGGSPTSLAEWVTGPEGPNRTLERFSISGTDLGIVWDNGDPANHEALMAFGDTFGYCKLHGQQWRYNTLLRSQDQSLADGITVSPGVPSDKYSGSPVRQAGFAKQVLPSIKWASHQEGMIPTAGIAVGHTQYINFMSIKEWGRDGEWSTNYSAVAVSPDNGQNWGIYPKTVRMPSGGNENFQQGAFMRTGDGYVYSYGTPSGRGGSAYLARAPQDAVADLSRYQYWNADQNNWVPNNPAAATVVVPGPVGEMSVQYNDHLKQYLMLYGNGANDVVARTAPAPQGPWSPEQLLVSSNQIPGGIYAPMIHPWSSGRDLYFNLSLWSAYDVMLMHTVLP